MQATQKIPWTTTEILEATGGDLLSGDLDRIFAGRVPRDKGHILGAGARDGDGAIPIVHD